MSSATYTNERQATSKPDAAECGVRESEWERTYRRLRENQLLWSPHPEIEDFLPRMREVSARRVLDAGCGDGKNLVALIREPELLCVGCDSSATAVGICEGRISKDHCSRRARLVHAELDQMPFPDGYFDAAICIDVVNHNQNPYPVFNELKRVLKPGGLLYFSLFNIEDEILRNPCYAASMRALPGGIPGREFLYEFVGSLGCTEQYYFRFLALSEVERFLAPTGLEIIDKQVKEWWNPPHPNFRPYEHTHRNIMVTAVNPAVS